MADWTRPYHGVSHLAGVDSRKGEVTIEEGPIATVAYLLPKGSFTAVKEEAFSNADEARRWAEKQAANFGWLR